MAYAKNGYPIEQASKIGHLKLMTHPLITNLITQFDEPELPPISCYPVKSGQIDLSENSRLERVVTIDGGQAIVPNKYRPENQLGFIQVAACMLRMKDLDYMR